MPCLEEKMVNSRSSPRPILSVVTRLEFYHSAEFGHYVLPRLESLPSLSIRQGLSIVAVPNRGFWVVTCPETQYECIPVVTDISTEWVAGKVRRSLLKAAQYYGFFWPEALVFNPHHADLRHAGGGQFTAHPQVFPTIARVCAYHLVCNNWTQYDDSTPH